MLLCGIRLEGEEAVGDAVLSLSRDPSDAFSGKPNGRTEPSDIVRQTLGWRSRLIKTSNAGVAFAAEMNDIIHQAGLQQSFLIGIYGAC